MRPKVDPIAKGYIEHQGIQYAHFDERRVTAFDRQEPDEVSRVVSRVLTIPVKTFTTLTNVRWRSDQGWTEPHDVTITGEYIMYIPQEDE